jgi:Xaa-Pro aminopeptidase
MPEASRVAQIQSEMVLAGLDAVVFRLAENVVLATGWYPQFGGATMVVVGRSGDPALLVPDYELDEVSSVWDGDLHGIPSIANEDATPGSVIPRLLRSLAEEHNAVGGLIGFEGSYESIAPPAFHGEPNAVGLPTQVLLKEAFETERLADFTEQLESLKSNKLDRELECIRRTNEVACFGLNAFREHAVPGKTEVEVMAAVEHAILVNGYGYMGARWVRGYCNIRSGSVLASGWQYWPARPRRIERGDVVLLELGTVVDGYWSDHTRTVVAGRATPQLRDAHAAVMHAVQAALDAAKPGACGGDVDAAARAACTSAGFVQFPHHTGHGTGFRYHESRPQIIPHGQDTLSSGQVIVVEPGIYGEELNGGVRHEDDAVITPNGAVPLATTDFPFELD